MRNTVMGLLVILSGAAPIKAEAPAHEPAQAPAQAQPAAPQIPALLTPYLTGDVVAPGDFRWMRGRFPGASAEEFEAFRAAAEFGEVCAAQSRVAIQKRLAAMGEAFDPRVGIYAQSTPCRQFRQLAIPADTTWETFSAAAEKVRPYALGILRATEFAEQQVIDQGDSAHQLRMRPLGEQTLRYAWIESQKQGGATASYSPLERVIHEGILLRALEDRDQANTKWLAAKVAAQGWPAQAKVGKDASDSAWLLVQHADADPAFQFAALRLMTPLATTGQVDPRNFAMLTDRVQLKLNGKQSYGTQWTCTKGKRTPLTLASDEAATDRLRATANLDTLKENAGRIDAMYGACPPGS